MSRIEGKPRKKKQTFRTFLYQWKGKGIAKGIKNVEKGGKGIEKGN